MVDSYSLTVINNSELPKPTFAVFATLPAVSSYDTLSLAWLTQQIDPGNQYVFKWNITWDFTWSAQGARPGYQWQGSGMLPADPLSAEECSALFTYNGDFQLAYAQGKATGDTLRVTDGPTVPPPSKEPSSLGLALNGSPISATDAGPNLYQTYTLHPTYYIDAGSYVAGQMVDTSSVTAFQVLEYLGGNTALTATLRDDNTWKVVGSKEIDFGQLLASRASW